MIKRNKNTNALGRGGGYNFEGMSIHRRNSYFYSGCQIEVLSSFFTAPCIHTLVIVSSRVSFGFGLAHVTCFGQCLVGRSDSMPVLSLGLKKHHICSLLILHLYHLYGGKNALALPLAQGSRATLADTRVCGEKQSHQANPGFQPNPSQPVDS